MDGSTCIRSRYYADSFELLLVSLRWLLWLSHLVVCEYQLKLKQLCPGQDAAFLWVVVDKKQLNRYKLNSMCYGVGVLIIRQDKTLIWALPYWLDANNNEHTSFFFFYSFFFFFWGWEWVRDWLLRLVAILWSNCNYSIYEWERVLMVLLVLTGIWTT